jgi:hypothetical protein
MGMQGREGEGEWTENWKDRGEESNGEKKEEKQRKLKLKESEIEDGRWKAECRSKENRRQSWKTGCRSQERQQEVIIATAMEARRKEEEWVR